MRALLTFLFAQPLTAGMGFQGISWDYVELEEIPGAMVAEVFHPEGYETAEHFRTNKAIINNIVLISTPEGKYSGVI